MTNLKELLKPRPPRVLVLHNFTDEQVEAILNFNTENITQEGFSRMFGMRGEFNDREKALDFVAKLQSQIKAEQSYLKDVAFKETLTDQEIIDYLNEAAYGDMASSGITWDVGYARHGSCNTCFKQTNECKCEGGPCLGVYFKQEDEPDNQGDYSYKYRTCKKCTCGGSWEHEHEVISLTEAHEMNRLVEEPPQLLYYDFSQIKLLSQ